MTGRIPVRTTQVCQFIDITDLVRTYLAERKVIEGRAVVFVPHTTAGITINENADPEVQHDILMHLDSMVPDRNEFRHSEGNSAAHIKASLMGSSVTMIVSDGRLQLGTWQSVYFCEFDGPRDRQVWIQITPG